MNEEIVEAIKRITGEESVHLEVPENSEFGDYSTNVAMQSSSRGEISPRDYAKELVAKFQSDKELSKVVEKIEVAGPGFINFFLKKEVLIDTLLGISSHKFVVRHSPKKNKKIMVEFAHPNTHKAFHIGHLRNISTGESIVRMLESVGYDVVRANYQGDVGMHIAKALWGIKKLGFDDQGDIKKRVEFLGKAYATGATAYEEDENAKKEVQEINKKIYSKDDEEVNKLYKDTRQWSLDYFDSIYKRVYSTFDRLFFESECYESGKKYAEEGLEKGILKKSEGAVIFPGSQYGLHDRVFITKENVPTYEAKDFGLVKLQIKEYEPDIIAHVVGPEQADYFKVVFKAQELLFPETKGRQLHVPYGWVRLKEGKMSSRTGKVILGESLLDEARSEILKSFKCQESVAEEIAVGAVKYSFLKVGREQDIAFDLKESISLEGNSGPYLQYTYARCKSVLVKSNFKGESLQGLTVEQLGNEELSLLRTFVHYPEVVIEAAERYAPNMICNYLYSLAQKYNGFYNSNKIIGGENERIRLLLTYATGELLKEGLNLLGIKAPKKM